MKTTFILLDFPQKCYINIKPIILKKKTYSLNKLQHIKIIIYVISKGIVTNGKSLLNLPALDFSWAYNRGQRFNSLSYFDSCHFQSCRPVSIDI